MTELVKRFIELQTQVNNEIDNFGQASEKSVIELEHVEALMTPEEIDQMLEHYKNDPDYINDQEIMSQWELWG